MAATTMAATTMAATTTTTPVRACLVGNSSLVSKLRGEASACPSYRAIVAAFRGGMDLAQLPASHPARQLRNVWHDLSLVDEDLLCVDGCRIFVPIGCRKSVLDRLHGAHPGITRMYYTARKHYFWPGLKNDVTNVVNQCTDCQGLQASQPVDVQIPTVASAPMEQTSADLFQLGTSHFFTFH